MCIYMLIRRSSHCVLIFILVKLHQFIPFSPAVESKQRRISKLTRKQEEEERKLCLEMEFEERKLTLELLRKLVNKDYTFN